MKITLPQITPGPWKLEDDRADFLVWNERCQYICRVDATETQSEQEGTANARTISAVPDMLAAMVDLVLCISLQLDEMAEAGIAIVPEFNAAHDALLKAGAQIEA